MRFIVHKILLIMRKTGKIIRGGLLDRQIAFLLDVSVHSTVKLMLFSIYKTELELTNAVSIMHAKVGNGGAQAI